ncbi:unnamed protein product, partial [Rotaria sp. Silwood2]
MKNIFGEALECKMAFQKHDLKSLLKATTFAVSSWITERHFRDHNDKAFFEIRRLPTVNTYLKFIPI